MLLVKQFKCFAALLCGAINERLIARKRDYLKPKSATRSEIRAAECIFTLSWLPSERCYSFAEAFITQAETGNADKKIWYSYTAWAAI